MTTNEAGDRAAGAGAGAQLAGWRSRWRLTYRPGPWLALAGPSTAVILQPASPHWSELITAIWEDVLRADSIEDLLGRMAGFRLEQMPSFAAFFWGPDGMRSLARGDVRLVDDRDGSVLLDGVGVQTWTEGSIGDRRRVRVQLAPPSDSPSLQLPLVIGAVGVSEVLVDIGPERQVDVSVPVGRGRFAEVGGASPDPDVVPTEAIRREPPDSEAAPGRHSASAGPVAATVPARRVAAVLRPSTGGQFDVDRPVLVGRAPSTREPGAGQPGAGHSGASELAADELPRLLSVPSPSRDISRTHLQIVPGDPDRATVEITDLGSTNGTILQWPDGSRSALAPDRPVLVGPGAVVDLGDGVMIGIEAPARS